MSKRRVNIVTIKIGFLQEDEFKSANNGATSSVWMSKKRANIVCMKIGLQQQDEFIRKWIIPTG